VDAVTGEVDVVVTKKNKRLKTKLAAATLSLLGTVSLASAGEFEGWDIDTSVLYYQESDNRVSAIEPVLNLRKQLNNDQFATFKLVIDVLTGATPNGATPSNIPQTFTRPSGNGIYTIAPGETPLDDTFKDTRVALSSAWTQSLDRLTKMTMGANLSKEFDFSSLGLNASLSRDLNQRNTTLTFGLAGEFDLIEPIGGIPIPLAAMVAPIGGQAQIQPRQGQDDSKTVIDAILGVAQVVNRYTLMEFNYSLSHSTGYQTDPFKLVTRVDGSGATVDYLFENRPDSRTKHSIYWLTRYHLSRDVLGTSYRFFTDDWGILSHTLDLTYRWKFLPKHYLEPHIRIYQQSKADFYRVGISNNAPLPKIASADYRLAKFNALTVGFTYGLNLKGASSFLLRIEYYLQDGDSNPDSAIGIQKNQDIFPDLQATILQIQYSF